MKIGIIGAGISGLSCAYRLESLGFTDIKIMEQSDEVGGLCKSKTIDGFIFDISGGKVFNSRYEEIVNWVFSLLARDKWKYQERNTKIAYKDLLINYPFELNLKELPESEAIDCILDFFETKVSRSKPDNFYSWILYNFGRAISEKYMIPYNEKIWNYPLRDMDFNWVEQKMPIPDKRQIISSIIKKDFKEKDIPHASFFYPLKGGIRSLINVIYEKIKSMVYKNYRVERIEKVNKKYIVNGNDKFDIIISTICVKDLIASIKSVPSRIKKYAKSFITNPITATLCECIPGSVSWIYIPGREINAHRIVFQGNFSPFNTPYDNKSSVIIETTGKVDPFEQLKDIQKIEILKRFNICNIIDSVYTPLAYLIFDKNHNIKMDLVDEYLDELGIIRVGRFSKRKYDNMDICIKKAFNTAEEILIDKR